MRNTLDRSTTLVALLLLLTACSEPPTTIARASGDAELAAAPVDASAATAVMSGLDNPRGLAFGPDGALYVAEAGRGGPPAPGLCFDNGGQVCYGPTGAISRLADGKQERVVTGLPSYANTKSGRGMGPNGIALHGNGNAYVTIGLEGDPNIRTLDPAFAGYARLVHIKGSALAPGHGKHDTEADTTRDREWEFVADLGDYEIAVNPDCGHIDSNPFGILADDGGVLIADAGANTIVRRASNGELSTFIHFTSRYSAPTGSDCPALPADYPATQPKETVPTSIVVGPDGAYYVGHLAGVPLVVGAANVYRVVPGSAPEVYRSGFTWITSIAFDPAGNLYVLEYRTDPKSNDKGELLRVAPDGSRTSVIKGLFQPTSVVVGPDGALYISNRGASIAKGEVLRYMP